MRDMFDDFLEELRRREAAARGEDPDAGKPRRARPVGPDPDDGGDDDPDRRSAPDDAPPKRRPRPVRSEPRRPRRRLGWWAIGLAILLLFLLFSVGLDLWTDALWFQSVGFDPVFWTRLGAQGTLFVAAGLGALAIIMANIGIAARLIPAAGGPGGPGGASFRALFERL
ncbi:MAG: UPF0182 family protein, partial [Chloroflexota bacterium]|nr:UPF0182 family protein [Chloroflexota bacterium]